MALAWRTHLAGRGMSPATINRRLSALRALTALGRTLGLIAWKIEIQNVRAAAYRDTRGPQRAGVIALLAAAAAQTGQRQAARDVALVRLLQRGRPRKRCLQARRWGLQRCVPCAPAWFLGGPYFSREPPFGLGRRDAMTSEGPRSKRPRQFVQRSYDDDD